MSLVALIGAGIVIGLAMMQDPNGTVHLVTIAIGIRGITFISKRVVATMNKDNGDIIDFAGWSLAGVSIADIIGKSMQGWGKIAGIFNTIGATYTKVDMFFENAGAWLDKITPF